MKLEERNGPVVRAKLFLNGSVAVVRYSFEGSLKKEYLSPSGEWVEMPEGSRPGLILEVQRETRDLIMGE